MSEIDPKQCVKCGGVGEHSLHCPNNNQQQAIDDHRRKAKEYVKGVVTVTVTGTQGAGKTILVGLISEFLKVECGFDGAEVVVRQHLPKERSLRDRLWQVKQEKDAKVILVDVQLL